MPPAPPLPSAPPAGTGGGSLGREVWRLSSATFVALVTEPLFLLADSAIVGHLGTAQLAALGVATAVLGTLVSLCIFLAYGTTAAVARYVGAGQRRRALTQGVDGLWLAAVLGALVTAVTWPLTGEVVALFDVGAEVAGQATTYLHVALVGAVPMLLLLAAVGVLRGLSDARTPMVVAVVANLANIVLNLVLVYGPGPFPHLGIAGSAWGTLVAQTGAAAAVTAVVVRAARAGGAALRPDLRGIGRAARTGVPLVVRTLLLRAALLVMTYAAARYGDPELATMQLALTIWSFLAFVLDALGISAQTLVGSSLGRGDLPAAQRLAGRLVRWGFAYGLLTGVALLACATVLPGLFTDDPRVRDLLPPVLLVAAAAQPVAGMVFALDGILIGAGDGPFLAWAHALVLAVFAPAAAWAVAAGDLTWLWVAFGTAFMGGRCVLLLLRERGDGWLVARS
jgi:putative MATE family efflux protein